jgi:hypothetical protein
MQLQILAAKLVADIATSETADATITTSSRSPSRTAALPIDRWLSDTHRRLPPPRTRRIVPSAPPSKWRRAAVYVALWGEVFEPV